MAWKLSVAALLSFLFILLGLGLRAGRTEGTKPAAAPVEARPEVRKLESPPRSAPPAVKLNRPKADGLPDLTRFQRRFLAGKGFAELRNDLASERLSLAAALGRERKLHADLLLADRRAPST